MGIKRIVDTDFWTDEKVETFTPEEKYFWLYLLTNPYTKQLGIYHITKKQMSFHLGYDIETVSKLLDRFENEHKLIKYVDSEIAILNFLKHSILKGGKPVEDCLRADLRNVKHKSLIAWVFNQLDDEKVNSTVSGVMTEWKESNKESINDIDNDNDNDNDSIVATIRERIVDVSSKDEFDVALDEFRKMRKKIKKPMSDRAEKMLITKLNNLSSDKETQIKILNQSIFHCWQDVYAIKEEPKREEPKKWGETPW